MPIDIGGAAINRPSTGGSGYTVISLTNPANSDGIIDTVELWAASTMGGVRVGTFFFVSGTTYECRASVVIGTVTSGAKRTFPGLSVAVLTGDFIGLYFTSGTLERSTSGGSGLVSSIGEHIDPTDQAVYGSLGATDNASLYGTGNGAFPGSVGKMAVMMMG